jgi:hypothetical protein
MKEHVRRAVALIAGAIITGTSPSSVYDDSESKRFPFSCYASNTMVDVFDFTVNCQITGSLRGGKLSLYHYAEASYITLEIKGTDFEGFDSDKKSYYIGSVQGKKISIYDYDQGRKFNYSL